MQTNYTFFSFRTFVTKVSYVVSVNGDEPVAPASPTTSALSTALQTKSIELCECVAHKARRLYLKTQAEMLTDKEEQLVAAVKKAWENTNTGQ